MVERLLIDEGQKVENLYPYRFQSLKESSLFDLTFKNGSYFHTKLFLIYYLAHKTPYKAFIASKKVGNAVQRNRSKRIMREFFNQEHDIPMMGIYILIAKKNILTCSHGKIQDEFLRSLRFLKKVNNC